MPCLVQQIDEKTTAGSLHLKLAVGKPHGWSLWDPGSYARRMWPTAMAGTRQHRQLRNWWSFPSFFNGCHFGSHWTKDTKSTSFVACLGCLYVKTARMFVQIFRSLHACMRFIIVRQCCTIHFRADPRNALTANHSASAQWCLVAYCHW